MSRHSDLIRFRHMLDNAREAVALIQGKTRESLDSERTIQLSLIRLVEVIGEAASRVSREGQVSYGNIPWEDVVGMRHRLIHGYDKVDLDILWVTVSEDLPQLIRELEEICR